MRFELFHIGKFTAYSYGLMIAVAIISAYLSVTYRAKKRGLEYEKIFNLTVVCAISGLLGAKLLYLITILPDIIKDPKQIFENPGGMVVYGGIILGIFGGSMYCIKQKWNFFEYFDLVMPSIALAQGFGRIGCFFAGCCYGKETTSRFALIFPSSGLAPSGVPLIPTQLISSGLDFLNCLVLILIARKNKVKGLIAGLYLMFYSVGRFILEYFRGDLERGTVGSVSTSQFISIFIFLIGLGIIVVRVIMYKKAPVKVVSGDDKKSESAITEEDDDNESEVLEEMKEDNTETKDSKESEEDETDDEEAKESSEDTTSKE